MRTCTKCHETKSLDNFTKDSARKDGLRAMCRACDTKRRLERGYEQPQRRKLLEEIRKLPCFVCGLEDSTVIQLHHVEEGYKSASGRRVNISTMVVRGGLEIFINELAKCIPLCANDHLRVHAETVELPTKRLKKEELYEQLQHIPRTGSNT